MSNYKPSAFHASISYFHSGETHEVKMVEGELHNSISGIYQIINSEQITPSDKAWKIFWKTMDEIGIHNWKYEKDSMMIILDGPSWEFSYTLNDKSFSLTDKPDGSHSIRNSDSPEVVNFLKAISVLIGNRKFG